MTARTFDERSRALALAARSGAPCRSPARCRGAGRPDCTGRQQHHAPDGARHSAGRRRLARAPRQRAARWRPALDGKRRRATHRLRERRLSTALCSALPPRRSRCTCRAAPRCCCRRSSPSSAAAIPRPAARAPRMNSPATWRAADSRSPADWRSASTRQAHEGALAGGGRTHRRARLRARHGLSARAHGVGGAHRRPGRRAGERVSPGHRPAALQFPAPQSADQRPVARHAGGRGGAPAAAR